MAVSCGRPEQISQILRTSPTRPIEERHLPSILPLYRSIYRTTRKSSGSQRSHGYSLQLATPLATSSLSSNRCDSMSMKIALKRRRRQKNGRKCRAKEKRGKRKGAEATKEEVLKRKDGYYNSLTDVEIAK